MKKPFKILDDVFVVGGPNITDPSDCFVYLIDGKEKLCLIDSGVGRSFNSLIFNLEKVGFNPQNLSLIIATHAHIDHIGGLFWFKEKWGVKILAHDLDAEAIGKGKGVGSEFYGVADHLCNVDR